MEILNRTLDTPAGPLKLVVPDESFLNDVARWPKAVVNLGRAEPPGWGLTFYDEAGALPGIRVAFGYFEREQDAQDVLAVQRLLMPASLAEFRRRGRAAVLLACAYLRAAGPYWQSGYVLFSTPDPAGPIDADRQAFDEVIGRGGTDVLFTFIAAAEHVWVSRGQPRRPISDLDVTGFDDCGAVAFDLLLAGDRVAWLRDELDGDGPLAKELVRAGLTEIVDFAAVPMKVPAAEAPDASATPTTP